MTSDEKPDNKSVPVTHFTLGKHRAKNKQEKSKNIGKTLVLRQAYKVHFREKKRSLLVNLKWTDFTHFHQKLWKTNVIIK